MASSKKGAELRATFSGSSDNTPEKCSKPPMLPKSETPDEDVENGTRKCLQGAKYLLQQGKEMWLMAGAKLQEAEKKLQEEEKKLQEEEKKLQEAEKKLQEERSLRMQLEQEVERLRGITAEPLTDSSKKTEDAVERVQETAGDRQETANSIQDTSVGIPEMSNDIEEMQNNVPESENDTQDIQQDVQESQNAIPETSRNVQKPAKVWEQAPRVSLWRRFKKAATPEHLREHKDWKHKWIQDWINSLPEPSEMSDMSDDFPPPPESIQETPDNVPEMSDDVQEISNEIILRPENIQETPNDVPEMVIDSGEVTIDIQQTRNINNSPDTLNNVPEVPNIQQGSNGVQDTPNAIQEMANNVQEPEMEHEQPPRVSLWRHLEMELTPKRLREHKEWKHKRIQDWLSSLPEPSGMSDVSEMSDLSEMSVVSNDSQLTVKNIEGTPSDVSEMVSDNCETTIDIEQMQNETNTQDTLNSVQEPDMVQDQPPEVSLWRRFKKAVTPKHRRQYKDRRHERTQE